VAPKVEEPAAPKVEPPKPEPEPVKPQRPTQTDPPKSEPVKVAPTIPAPPKVTGVEGDVETVKPPKADERRISNVAVDSDIRAFINEIGSQAGVTIVPDETIPEMNVTVEFKNEPIESALEKLSLLAGAYWKRKSPGVYLLSKATPTASFFREFAATKMYFPRNQPATSITAVLSNVFKPYVSVDQKINMIGITAPEPLLLRIMEDVRMADSASRQFVVEAMVVELNYENGKDFGFSWSWQNFGLGADLTLNYAKAGFQDIVKLKALLENRQASLRANPRVNAFEGREAQFTVGQDSYYSLLSGNANVPFSQIQLIRTGVTLKFTGLVGEDGTITLNLEPEVSDAVVAINGNPTTNVRRASTNIRLKDGETIVLAGLVQQMTDKRVVRIPLLGQIPILGNLFSSQRSTNRKTDVIILITPHLTERGAGVGGMDIGSGAGGSIKGEKRD